MTKKSCQKCARGINHNGCTPEKCFPDSGERFKLFLDHSDNPKKFCWECGQRLTRARTNPASPEYSEISLKCPAHGIVGFIDEQFRKKSKAPAG